MRFEDDREFLFMRDICGRAIRFYRSDERRGVHIRYDDVAIVSDDATVAEIAQALDIVREHAEGGDG